MSPPLGFAVATLGLVIMVVGVAGTNVVALRFMPKLMSRRAAVLAERRQGGGVSRSDQKTAHEFVAVLTLFTALASLGLTIMLVGLVVGGSLVNWAPLLPLAMTVLSIALAAYSRWHLRQLGNV